MSGNYNKSDQLLKRIVDDMSDAISVIDEDGIIQFYNESFSHIAFRNVGKQIKNGEPFHHFIEDCKLPQFEKAITCAKRGEQIVFEEEYNSSAAQKITIEYAVKPMKLTADLSVILIKGKNLYNNKDAGNDNLFVSRDMEALINSTQELLWSVSRDFNLITANNSFIKYIKTISGIYLQKGDSLVDQRSFQPAIVQFWKKAYQQVLTGKSFKEEFFMSGAEVANDIWWDISLNPIYKGESVEAISCYAINITKRKLVEQQIRNSEARLAEAQKVAKVGSWETDLFSLIVTWSDETYRIFELEPNGSCSHKSFLEFVHPEDRIKVDTAFKNSLATEDITLVEHRIITASGITKSIEERWHIVRKEGQPVKAIGTCMDITESVRAREKIEDLELRYRQIVETVQEGIWLIDENYVTTFVNNKMSEIFEYTKEELIGKDIYFFMDSDGKEKAAKLMLKKKHGEPTHDEFRIFTKFGNQIWIHISANPIFDNEGNYKGSVGILTDITEKKNAEAHALGTNQQLRILYAYMENVREEERKRISREIHDELGQQLTAIKMDVFGLKKKLFALDENIEFKIKEIFSAIDNSINTVRRIASELRPGILDDLGLLEAIKWQISEFMDRTQIPIEFFTNIDAETFSPEVTIAVFRIFQESLTNIARHAQASFVTCELMKPDHHLMLTITDNGVGFNTDKKDKVNRLGILGMKERIRLLSGTFELTSEVKKGTCIKIIIPLTE